MDIYQAKFIFTVELPGKIDKETEYSCVLKRIQQKEGMVAIKENNLGGLTYTYRMENLDDITLLEEGKVSKGTNKRKSQARALRMAIMGYWEEHTDQSIDFEDYYKQQISKIIDKYNI